LLILQYYSAGVSGCIACCDTVLQVSVVVLHVVTLCCRC